MISPLTTCDALVSTPAEHDALTALRAATHATAGSMEQHCLRVRHIAAALAQRRGWAIDDEVLTVAALLHDIGLYDGIATADTYTADGAAFARSLLTQHGWSPARSALCCEAIDRHHQLRRQHVRGPEVEALRLADLVDLSGGLLSFGLQRTWIHQLRASIPVNRFLSDTLHEFARLLRDRPRTLPRIFMPNRSSRP
jgi:putative nucleotidyltransferase with HDIG domain